MIKQCGLSLEAAHQLLDIIRINPEASYAVIAEIARKNYWFKDEKIKICSKSVSNFAVANGIHRRKSAAKYSPEQQCDLKPVETISDEALELIAKTIGSNLPRDKKLKIVEALL